jgi:DNA-binding response OmpR family regulator
MEAQHLPRRFAGLDFYHNRGEHAIIIGTLEVRDQEVLMHTVLVVDDDPIIVKLLSMTLSVNNYEVLTAPNGEEGLKVAMDKQPEIILLDIMMPIMDGLTMLEELRKVSDIPVIIISAFGSPEKVDKARELGIECFLNKPFNYTVVLEMLDLIFETDETTEIV